jgi:hypothetical protein
MATDYFLYHFPMCEGIWKPKLRMSLGFPGCVLGKQGWPAQWLPRGKAREQALALVCSHAAHRSQAQAAETGLRVVSNTKGEGKHWVGQARAETVTRQDLPMLARLRANPTAGSVLGLQCPGLVQSGSHKTGWARKPAHPSQPSDPAQKGSPEEVNKDNIKPFYWKLVKKQGTAFDGLDCNASWEKSILTKTSLVITDVFL